VDPFPYDSFNSVEKTRMFTVGVEGGSSRGRMSCIDCSINSCLL
jgi:hypothetical protein